MIKNIYSYNLVDSYLSPNLECDLYLIEAGKKNEKHYSIVAVKDSGRFVDGSEEFYNTCTVNKNKKRKEKQQIALIPFGLGIFFALTMSVLIFVSIPLAIVGIYLLAVPPYSPWKGLPTPQEISSVIAES
jgi:hypothetical protein